jgi:uncharacterized membrane protein
VRRRTIVWEGIQLGIIAAMFVAAAIRWPSLPERIPVHWDASGQVDGYGGKFVGLLLLPMIAVGLYLLLRFIPRIDPARANYESFAGTYLLIRVVLMLYLGYFYLVMNLALGEPEGFPFDQLVYGAVAVLFIVLGAAMGKIRPNWFAGVRTPWTLSSKLSWVKTHRIAGWVFIASGAVTGIAAVFSGPAAFVVMMATILPGTAFLFVYSYWVWRDDPDRVAAQDTTPAESP